MTQADHLLANNYDVVIVGAGPAGLSTAIQLKKLGVRDIIVLDRADSAGGNPRFCGHSPFGMREFKRAYLGPAYAKKLVSTAKDLGVLIALNTSVIRLGEGGFLTLSTVNGIQQLQAKRVVLSTGIREMPRAPRFVSGDRVPETLNTGTLQSLVYSGQKVTFKSPVIIGSELVAFSALETCRKAGIKPVAIIEENRQVSSPKVFELFPKLLGVEIFTQAKLNKIKGEDCVTGVSISQPDGMNKHIECDAVIFTGKFIPEASLVRSAGIKIDKRTQGPEVDQFGRCSDPAYFATGNVLRPVETAGWCWSEGKQTAGYVKQSLNGELPERDSCFPVKITGENIRYVIPQQISFSTDQVSTMGAKYCQLRLNHTGKSQTLRLTINSSDFISRKFNKRAEQRILIPLPDFSQVSQHKELIIKCE